jgi:RND family efflux transporter MFP subunit
VEAISPWGHGLRIWLATSAALYAAFWLQLASPVSAALTVAILAQPRRGQALSRAMYRFAGTAVGGVASVILVAAFGQERTLILAGSTAWLGLCVFVAAYLPGDRAYGAVLSGYTVGIVVVANIALPQGVFITTVERVAATALGIAAVLLVNIGLGSPRVWTGLQIRLLAAADITRDFVRSALRDGPPEPARVAAVLSTVIALRDDARFIAGETTDGANRAAGARSAIAALSGMIAASRSLAVPVASGVIAPIRAQCLAVIDAGGELRWAAFARQLVIAPREGSTPGIVRVRQHGLDLIDATRQLQDGLEALSTGARPQWAASLPVHRDYQVALRDAVRIMIGFGISAAAFAASGWPATSTSLSLVATLCGLSAVAPNPAKFATGALVSAPIAIAASGIVRFVILDGSQGFVVLVLAMAPVTFLACYLMLQKTTAATGLLLNVFMVTLVSPSNPQTYDFQSFLDTAVLIGLAVMVLFLTSRLVLPISAQQRLRWLVRSSRQSLADIINGHRRSAQSQRARSDDRLAQFATWSAGGGVLPDIGLPSMLVMADLAVAAAGVNGALRQTGNIEATRNVRAAFLRADAAALDTIAEGLLGALPSITASLRPGTTRAIAEISAAAGVIRARRAWPIAALAKDAGGVEAVMKQIRIRSGLPYRVARYSATALILICSAVAGLLIWNVYVTSPWTRDGQVRVQVVNVAPRVSGEITSVEVKDNQIVRKGDLLYVIDPFDYAVARATAVANAESRETDLADKEGRTMRRRALTTLSTSIEEKQQFDAAFKMARAAVADALAQRAQAEVNLRRTEVRSPVNGYVTNLLLRPGDYATAGLINISIIDSDSFWVDGYFEETKLARLRVGDSATTQLMGYAAPLRGVVESVTRGISSAQAASSTQGLPNIDPIYTWVRLAQRIPVRVRITDVPPDVVLVAGMTCTVSVIEPPQLDQGWMIRLGRRLLGVSYAP